MRQLSRAGGGITNGERFGQGVAGARGTRNVPALLNRAWGRSFFWDGRAATLEDQVLQPIVHPDELAMSPAGIVALARSDRYRDRFAQAFATPIVSGFPGAPKRDLREGGSRTAAISGRSIDPYGGLSGEDAATMHQVAFARMRGVAWPYSAARRDARGVMSDRRSPTRSFITPASRGGQAD